MIMNTDLSKLYITAKQHKDTHSHCGAEPYLDYEYLFNFIKNKNSENILELGSGIGFTAQVMQLAAPDALIDSIENNSVHVQFAKNWTKENSISNINFIQADVHKILPYLESNKYDLIFFDVYGPKEKYLVDFERILKIGGILYSVNSHLKSAEKKYFDYLDNSLNWQIIDKFNDTVIYKKNVIKF